MGLSTHFPHFSPQSYYKLHIRFVNTFQSILGDFSAISVFWVENGVAPDVDWAAQSFVRARVTQKAPTLFCARPRGKICILEVSVSDPMRIDILSLFPETFVSPLNQSIIKRAREQALVDIVIHDIRDYTHDKHHTADDYPYGGGPGMVLKPEPIFEAAEAVEKQLGVSEIPVILVTPQGRLFSQSVAQELALHPHLLLICGHYEGLDERICEHLVTDQISIGDYVLSGGELAALVVVDAVVRLIPGVLGSDDSASSDSHSDGLLEYPQYTRPQVYRGWSVPEVLLSGNHGEIAEWRRRQAILRTAKRRPDLLEKGKICEEERKWMLENLLSPK
jgi:tRNA (guanine37-N1)-methyltransferase